MKTIEQIARDMREGTFPAKSEATLQEQEWERLNAVFHDALAKYPYSHHALHYLWNNAIATGLKQFKEPPPVSRS